MRLIETVSELERAATELGDPTRFYLDTEFDSSRQGTVLSLVQLSAQTPGGPVSDPYLIDALRLGSLRPLAPVLGRAEATWVLHAGLQDVDLLMSALGLKSPPRLFDTQVVWSLVSPEHGVSLAYLLYRLLGQRPSKAHQQDDWLRRPLPRSLLEYAAADIAHLPEIERHLLEQLTRLGRLGAAYEASREVLLPAPTPTPPLSLAAFRNAWQLEPPNQAALRALIEWHNRASEKDPRFEVPPKTLLAIAARLPDNSGDLRRIKGVPPRIADRHGRDILSLLRRSSEAALAEHVPLEPIPYATLEEIQVDGWLEFARAELCFTVEIAPEIALPARLLRRMASAIHRNDNDPRAAVTELTGWRAAVLGETLERILSGVAPR